MLDAGAVRKSESHESSFPRDCRQVFCWQMATDFLCRNSIFKTEFILQYLSEPELRRRIRRGLLKVEQLHALARDVFYGRRGRINARELWEQMNTCSCLNLILACIVYWQAREISRVLSQCDPVANKVDTSLLEHVSPIEWDNVVLYGQYVLDRKLVRRGRRSTKVALSV